MHLTIGIDIAGIQEQSYGLTVRSFLGVSTWRGSWRRHSNVIFGRKRVEVAHEQIGPTSIGRQHFKKSRNLVDG